MNQKILLTGGAGYIGSHTAVELLCAGYDVVIADNFSNSSPDVVARIARITGKTVQQYAVDVADRNALRQIFAAQQIDAVIHFAGFKAVSESVKQPLLYYRNNLDTTLTLLEVMQEYGVKQFVFSSSATVYGAAEKIPISEGEKTACLNPYGWTKWMSEQILRDVCAADAAFSAVLLRYFNPIGAHTSGMLGEQPQGVPNNLLPYIAMVAEGRLDCLNVFGDDYDTPDGTGIRDYIHVVDLAKGHLKAMEYAKMHTGTETFNLGTGKGYSVLEIIKTFERVNQVKVPYQIVGRRLGDVDANYTDTQKAARLLGWQAEKDLEDMCRDIWRWQKSAAYQQEETDCIRKKQNP